MASEVRPNLSLQITVGGITSSLKSSGAYDLATITVCTRQSIATGSWQALNTTGLSAIARIHLTNEDATNYVEFSYDSGGSVKIAKLVAGDGNHLTPPAATATIYARANTAACWVSFLAC